MSMNIATFLYMVSAFCFIMSLKGLSSATTSKSGNLFGIFGMSIAILTTVLLPSVNSYKWIFFAIIIGAVIGTYIAKKIQMTALPQLVAFFHSLVGLAAVFVAGAALYNPEGFAIGVADQMNSSSLVEMGLGSVIGAITFSGSIIAFAKLQGLIGGKPFLFTKQHHLNALILISLVVLIGIFVLTQSKFLFWIVTIIALVLGVLVIIPIGGADMPVVISMLNSYSGWAAAGIGFTLGNHLLIITGALVGASGAILSYIMCKGMNRSIFNVILGGFGSEAQTSNKNSDVKSDQKEITLESDNKSNVQTSTFEEAAKIIDKAKSVIIVPGYGMAVSQAQHSLREISDYLKSKSCKVRYAIHPVAGRMPGHMNVLLAEANVDYDDVIELEEINEDFEKTDVAFVIGANDITNPSAKNDPKSPIYGMPILDVEKAKTVFFVKRSLASGYAGVDNSLFYQKNTFMLLGDAKKVCEELLKFLKKD
jgi:H+-translocating NAD(P) transhydrogenase subunit beta